MGADRTAGTGPGREGRVLARRDEQISSKPVRLVFQRPDLRATLAYEHPIEQTGNKVDNDLFTMQLQAKF